MSPATLGNGTLPRGPLHIPEGDDSWGPVPSTKLHAQVPTASGLTAFAHYSCCASIVGLELIVNLRGLETCDLLLRQQFLQLFALIGGEHLFPLLNGTNARDPEIRAQALDLPYFCFDLHHIDFVGNEKTIEIHLGNTKVGIPANRFFLEVVLQLLKTFDLGGGKVELLAVAEDKSDQRSFLTLHGAAAEILSPATKPFTQLAAKIIQTLRKLLVYGRLCSFKRGSQTR